MRETKGLGMRETKRHRDVETQWCARGQRTSSLRLSVARSLRYPSLCPRSAFTLTEILIVIGLIVLLLALSVPAFNLISGGRSIEGATNQISAALGRARAEALGFQRVAGIMFFVDPRTQRKSIAIVSASGKAPPAGIDVLLEFADADFITLPVGVDAQTIHNRDSTTVADRYIGYNAAGRPTTGSGSLTCSAAYGGVILFDGSGRLASLTYGFRGGVADLNAVSPNNRSRINQSLGFSLVATPEDFLPGPQAIVANPARSQLGIVLVEQDRFLTAGGDDPDTLFTTGAPTHPPREATEETWLDLNSTPLLVNRFNGTLVRGE